MVEAALKSPSFPLFQRGKESCDAYFVSSATGRLVPPFSKGRLGGIFSVEFLAAADADFFTTSLFQGRKFALQNSNPSLRWTQGRLLEKHALSTGRGREIFARS